MALEPITRQEQIIAGKDLEPITRMEKFLKEYGGGGGGGSASEYFETVGGDTLTWDGNTEGLTGVDLDGAGTNTHYLVSEITPTTEALAGGVVLTASGASVTDVYDTGVGLIVIGSFTCFIVHENAVGVDIDGLFFPKAGIYIATGGEGEISLTINGYTGFTTTKLKKEYIPVDYIKQLIAEVTGN